MNYKTKKPYSSTTWHHDEKKIDLFFTGVLDAGTNLVNRQHLVIKDLDYYQYNKSRIANELKNGN